MAPRRGKSRELPTDLQTSLTIDPNARATPIGSCHTRLYQERFLTTEQAKSEPNRYNSHLYGPDHVTVRRLRGTAKIVGSPSTGSGLLGTLRCFDLAKSIQQSSQLSKTDSLALLPHHSARQSSCQPKRSYSICDQPRGEARKRKTRYPNDYFLQALTLFDPNGAARGVT